MCDFRETSVELLGQFPSHYVGPLNIYSFQRQRKQQQTVSRWFTNAAHFIVMVCVCVRQRFYYSINSTLFK